MEGTRRTFDLEAIRVDFPILSRQVHGKPLVYLDSAASAPRGVPVPAGQPAAVVEVSVQA